ncbi:MAG: stage V sporulation protein AA [Lachnospiraceae bacterium]|nr:stage V sporulation protein AA [Lachnospiraceae bacterium]
MKRNIVYLKANQNVKVTSDKVYLKDVFKITCADSLLLTKLKLVLIYDFANKSANLSLDTAKKVQQNPFNGDRAVISILKVIEIIQNIGVDAEIVSLGENDIVLEKIKPQKESNLQISLKVIFVSLICFFGTAFTIMAFHNDINVIGLFEQIYGLFGTEYPGGAGALEIGYSIGLGVGIIVFYNHLGKRRITKDPTPLEVEMRIYEDDVNQTLIDNAEREQIEVDVS